VNEFAFVIPFSSVLKPDRNGMKMQRMARIKIEESLGDVLNGVNCIMFFVT